MDKQGIFLVNQDSSQIWPLKPDKRNIIGRGLAVEEDSSTILLPHPTVSKIHACVYLETETYHWCFENMSRNGSLVNEHSVSRPLPLQHGDQIKIGPHTLIFYENFRADEGTMETPILGDSDFAQETSISMVEVIGTSIFFGLLLFLFYQGLK